MKAYGKRVLIKPDPIEEKSAGGIVLPKTAQKETHTGTVINTGKEVEAWIQDGSYVLFFSQAGISVIHNDLPHLLVSPENILAIL